MAHNLNFNNGKTSFASTQKAWHGLGQIVNNAMTSEGAIKLAQLDYNVIKAPVMANLTPENSPFDLNKTYCVPDHYATMRDDTREVFGIVGKRYEIVQNRDAFTFFDAIVGQGQAIFETAGALGKGERIFVTAKMPDYIRIDGTDDITEVYVILTSSHDGSGAIIAAITPIRVVCNNTLNAALRSVTNKVSIRHTTNCEAKLAQAHKLLGISNKYITEAQATFNHLRTKQVTDEQFKKLVLDLFPSGKEDKDSTRILNIRNEVFQSYYSGIGQKEILGTGWGAFNGLTHYTSHKNYRDQESKFDNLLLDGTSQKVTDKAMELILAL